MKRNKICFLVLLLLSFAFAQNNKSTLTILTPDTENVSESWLAGVVAGRLSSNFSRYTNYTLVDYENEKKIKELQKKSLTAAYSEDTALEIGNLTTANHGLFTTIIKTGSGYLLTGSFTNLKTGERKTAQAPERKTIEELYNIPGCAADRLFLSLCGSLSIVLTPSQRYEIEHGDKNLTYEEQVKKAKEDEALFAKQLEELDAQLLTLKTSTDASASAQAAKLEAARVLAEQKRFAALQNTKRLEEEARLKLEDEQKEASRNAEQKKKRDEMAKEAERRANEVRKSILEKSSIYSQVTIVEAKKRAVVDIRSNVDAEVQEIESALTKEMEEKVELKDKEDFRKVDKDKDNNVLPEARALRDKEIEAIKADYRARIQAETAKIEAAPKAQEKSLLAEITNDYKELAKNHIVSSLTPDLKYSIQTYDGSRNGWDVTLYLYSEGIPLLEKTILLEYKDLTGKKPPKRSDKEAFEDYGDKVDLYDSLFSRGEPIIMFEVDLSATPRSVPSQYNFNFGNISVKATDTGAILDTHKINDSKIMVFSPAYDIRSREELAAAEKAEQKRQQKREQEEYNKQLAEQKQQLLAELEEQKMRDAEEHAEQRRQRKKQRRDAKVEYISGLHLGGGWSFPFNKDSEEGEEIETTFCLDGAINIGFSRYIFMQISGGLTGTPYDLREIIDSNLMGDAFFSLGLYKDFFSLNMMYGYLSVGAGTLIGKTDGAWIDSEKQKEFDKALYFAMKYSLGLEIMFSKFGMYVQMDIVNPIKYGINMDVVLGFSYHFYR